jgi:hypothetical protein
VLVPAVEPKDTLAVIVPLVVMGDPLIESPAPASATLVTDPLPDAAAAHSVS